MEPLFLVICDSGEYVVCAYRNREQAELHVEHCTEVGARFNPPPLVGEDYAGHETLLRHYWEQHEPAYLDAMRELDPEARIQSLKQGDYRVEETSLLAEVPMLTRA